MFELVWLGGPVLAAFLVALLTPRRWSWPAVLAVGLLAAAAWIALSYFSAPHAYDGDSDGEMYLGRWWEPRFTMFLVVVGYLFWALGAALGIGMRALVRRGLTPKR